MVCREHLRQLMGGFGAAERPSGGIGVSPSVDVKFGGLEGFLSLRRVWAGVWAEGGAGGLAGARG